MQVSTQLTVERRTGEHRYEVLVEVSAEVECNRHVLRLAGPIKAMRTDARSIELGPEEEALAHDALLDVAAERRYQEEQAEEEDRQHDRRSEEGEGSPVGKWTGVST
jgi:hypothetical protein